MLPVRQRLEVDLRRGADETTSHIRVLGVPLGTGLHGFDRLERRLSAMAQADPTSTGRIAASAWVPHGDVVRCLDAFLAAGVDEVDFTGPPPSRRRR